MGDNEDHEAGRIVQCNKSESTHHEHKDYKANSISTTKYNVATFLPKGLYEQFRRVANLYFVCVAALSLTPFSPVSPITTWAPLLIVIGISMLKEALEDYKRHKQDMEQNNSLVEAFDEHGHKITTNWFKLRPGDVCVVKRDQFFPADLLFLNSSNSEGVCYVETKNLDGETNLKLKKCLDSTAQLTDDTAGGWEALLKCDGPNDSLYTFQGNLYFKDESGVDTTLPLSPGNMLLRGSNLRNTEWIMGMVVYAGHDTKVMMNSRAAPSKRSMLERKMDYIVLSMLTLMIAMCVTGSTYLGIRTKNEERDQMWYLLDLKSEMTGGTTASQYDYRKSPLVGVYVGITQFILYGYLIPISLYVSLEMVKVAQSMYFINKDRRMYHEETDTPAAARTSNLNEELGQVRTILSDKTGTLTRNTMEYFKCTIGGVKYGSGFTDIERSLAARNGKAVPKASSIPIEKGFNFTDDRLLGKKGELLWGKEPTADTIRKFFEVLAVCHTVIPEGETTREKIKYQAESPDEAAFVVAAKRFGFFFYRRTTTHVFVKEATGDGGEVDRAYEILAVLEFNSTRKRMSVIVRDPEGKLLLMCKGADSVIYERMAVTNEHRSISAQHMDEFAQAGLRTLCLSYAEIDPQFYARWSEEYFAAKTALQGRDAKLEAVAETIEKDLILLGSTAIEDKLQEGVPECIAHLAQAGINIWVLTGDKQDTAINIGMACSLLRTDMTQYIISLDDLVKECEGRTNDKGVRERAKEQVGAQLHDCLAKIREAEKMGNSAAALVVDGFGLTFAMMEDLQPVFWELGEKCQAVICCRVSPLQKALVTGMVKAAGKTTLAIGDGANDVGMIQAAHIGVGISGQEGMQAVMASDFAIAQFRYLETLVLVHGRYNYKRIARMVTYFFYKNIVFGFSIFWYNAFTFFSGQPCYNDYGMSCFNLFFTSLQVVLVAVLDQDVSRRMAKRYPGLYGQGQRNDYFRFPVILYWALNALYQSIAVFLAFFWGQYRLHSDRGNGQTMDMWGAGSAMYTVIVITVTLQLAINIQFWTIPHIFVFMFGIGLKYAFVLVMNGISPSFATSASHLFIDNVGPIPSYWLMVGLVPVIALLPDFTIRAFKRIYYPDDDQIVQEMAILHKRQNRDQEGSQLSMDASSMGAPADASMNYMATGDDSPGASRHNGGPSDSPPLRRGDVEMAAARPASGRTA